MNVGANLAPAPARPKIRGPFLAGATAAIVFFGGFGGWAAVAPLSSAANAPGQIRVESYRKTVQHLEGGIIQTILVREGDLVREGQVLMRLDDTQSGATAELIRGQLGAERALEARLLAERSEHDVVAFPDALEERRDEVGMSLILAGQESIFKSRVTSLNGQIEILEQRVSQLDEEIKSNEAQLESASKQAVLVVEEQAIIQKLVDRGLEGRPRLLEIERRLAELEGRRGQVSALIARSRQAIGETRMQMSNLKNTRRDEVEAELRIAQTRIAEFEQRLRAALDIQNRTEIVAPEDGRVVNLRHVTPGGIIKAGDPVLDLVPQGDTLVVQARVAPIDIDKVYAGLPAEIRLTSLNSRRLPIIVGRVTQVSADALADSRTGESYYEAEVEIAPEGIAALGDAQLYPGMPADVLILTGERTPLEYLLDPLLDSFRHSMRED